MNQYLTGLSSPYLPGNICSLVVVHSEAITVLLKAAQGSFYMGKI